MKNASKKWYNYMFAILIIGIAFCGAYLPYVFTKGVEWPAKYIIYCIFFSGVAVILIGFISQDIYRGVIRHRINDWDNKLDQKFIDKAWMIFYPFFVSGLFLIVSGLIVNIFLK